VLEPAAGTGNWTEYLARRAEQVTVIDASGEALKVNKARLQRARLIERVSYHHADVLSWTSDVQYDAIFLAFWLSHLPSILLPPFLTRMAGMLKPEGVLLILEGLYTVENTALGELRERHHGTKRLTDEVELRTLNDGRTFRIIKRYDSPEHWAARVREVNLRAHIGSSGEQFLYAITHRVGNGSEAW
jgi:demethylmenaquinone methyltransferase/2-methoxy-6-polyprenyl-1,4-benzoquinol methylase